MAAARVSSAASSETTQVLSLRNPSAGSGGEQHRNDWKARLRPLPVERQIPLPLLPGTEPFAPRKTATAPQSARVRSSACGHGCPAARYQRSRKTRIAALVQAPGDLRHRRVIDGVIAEEDVEPVPQRPSPGR